MNNQTKTPKPRNKHEQVFDRRMDILKTVADFNNSGKQPDYEELRQKMFGDPDYYGWECDALQINANSGWLVRNHFLKGGFCGLQITEHGLIALKRGVFI